LTRQRIELLAPARTATIGIEAIRHGADAVYIGGPVFGARHNATNPIADIATLVAFAHRYHARIYVTLNTILHDSELEAAQRQIEALYQAGVDALIIQDMGLLELTLPPIELHASTQCDIRSAEKARFLAAAGLSQLVLARELDLGQIAAIRAALPADIVLEYFIHGALCVAYSGQCYISHAQTGRSANRGDCSQACRLPYTLQDESGAVIAYQQHLLSLKDNNQSHNLRALIGAGVTSFKIEGRYKEMAYVKNITGHYRQLLDEILAERSDLAPLSSGKTRLLFSPDTEKSFHRGATDYYTHGRGEEVGAFTTPAFIGLPVGQVVRCGSDHLDILATAPLANGDGLNYRHKREMIGVQANIVKDLGVANGGSGRMRRWPISPALSAAPPSTVIVITVGNSR
jgi:23S rRNA 5-hydroxycytidine C2501 synthase